MGRATRRPLLEAECSYAFVMSRRSLIADLEDCEEALADRDPGERKVGEQQNLLFLLSQCESLDPLRSAKGCEHQDHAILAVSDFGFVIVSVCMRVSTFLC